MKILSFTIIFTLWGIAFGNCQGPTLSKSMKQTSSEVEEHTSVLQEDKNPEDHSDIARLQKSPDNEGYQEKPSGISNKLRGKDEIEWIEPVELSPLEHALAGTPVYLDTNETSERDTVEKRGEPVTPPNTPECWRRMREMVGNITGSILGRSNNKNKSENQDTGSIYHEKPDENPPAISDDAAIDASLGDDTEESFFKNLRLKLGLDDEYSVSTPSTSTDTSATPTTPIEEELVEPKVVASKLKPLYFEGIPRTYQLGSITIKYAYRPTGFCRGCESPTTTPRPQKTEEAIYRATTNTPEGYPRCITTRNGYNQLLEEDITHPVYWSRLLPLGQHRIHDADTAEALERLHKCILTRRPIAAEYMGRVMALEKRINDVLTTVESRFGMATVSLSMRRTYHELHEDFIGLINRVSKYFKGLSLIITHLLDQYKCKPHVVSMKPVSFFPLKAGIVEREFDQCQHDENYGTFISLRTRFNTWELNVLTLLYEIESASEEIWLTHLMADDRGKDIMINKLIKFDERLRVPLCFRAPDTLRYERDVLSFAAELERSPKILGMSRKVVFGYKYDAERVKRKGTVRSKIYFDMYKDKHPLYVIHRFMHENDPDNGNFKYDIELATKPPCTRHIFKHYKKNNKHRFFWYASGKNKANGPCSRYINYARCYNEFRFSKLESYYHILPYVHEHYKDDPRYIYFMNRFLAFHGRVAEAKRMLAQKAAEEGLEKPEEYRRTLSWKEIKEQQRREVADLYEKYGIKENIIVKIGDGKSFTVKPDGFKVHGEYYSRIDKKERHSPYDIYTPYYRTRNSSKRRRFRERGRPLDPAERCKTRRERLLKRRAEREAKEGPKAYLKQFVKQKKSFKVLPPPGWVPDECRHMIDVINAPQETAVSCS
ncbi:hypothetical protein BaOVIS_004430 [Babesia ovis]|uniref:Uncharacterized protein n=1 Tax=Babesia ovis TaxID=5869 RepID=A0A9W5WTQ8_BABOV|nr:hypothetical protein BaOVIS_004430 [Babesia ovis]